MNGIQAAQVLTSVEGRVGRIRLNRPKAIHALNPGMVDIITQALLAWRGDDAVVAVMIDHAPAPDGDPKLSRGFCAGGDIAMIAQSAKVDCVEADRFFFDEYRMNHLLFVYNKPVVTFMDGITMGGGVGIAAPSRYRIATERTLLAMPETGIGLFPDVGGGWFLPRLPGRVGAWLAVTGARIDGADALSIGMATHYMASDRLDGVKAQIIADPGRLSEILDAGRTRPPPAKLNALRGDIDRLFASERYEDILAALRTDGAEWAQKQLALLAPKSPQTVKVALRQLAEGARIADFADNMRNEYRIARHVIRRPDFVEGVRALIFDKDNAPRWNPASAGNVTDELIQSLFAPLPPEQEWTPLPELGERG
ncbi:enoyl-CoA hydratase/isomerase family protein [Sphingobium sp. AN641]|uniref:enoyl-CoA hydratase/isomerase family protein n=1 Tax=Sphingobium sp. AN641 TaxID=3133443 RepID=UPI0030C59925